MAEHGSTASGPEMSPPERPRLELRPLTVELLDEAAALLAARHRAQRLAEPGLAAAFGEPATARTEIEALLARDDATGVAALRGGRLAGYLVGTMRADDKWGANRWVEAAGHAVATGESELVRDLYGFAAEGWVEDGRTSHSVIVPATDPALVDAWFRVGFGQQHVHAIREVPTAGEAPHPNGLVIRRAQRDDIPTLAALEIVLPAHQARSPVFSRQAVPTLEAGIAEWEADFDDARYETFVAEHDGRVIGSAVGCSIEVSSEHVGLTRPRDAAYLGFAAVLPEARGFGAGRALGEAVLFWARDAGYPTIVTDWRGTNLLSSRTWPRLGFRSTFLRLHRAIA